MQISSRVPCESSSSIPQNPPANVGAPPVMAGWNTGDVELGTNRHVAIVFAFDDRSESQGVRPPYRTFNPYRPSTRASAV